MAVINLGLAGLQIGAGLALSGSGGNVLSVSVSNSITITGAGNGSVQLVGDSASPAASSYYGTNNLGALGYYTLASGEVASAQGTAGQVLVNGTSGSPQTGAITLTLASAILNVNSITASSATDLTLFGGSSGAELDLGQGANGNVTLTPSGTGQLLIQPTNQVTSAIFKNSAANGNTYIQVTAANQTTVTLGASYATAGAVGTTNNYPFQILSNNLVAAQYTGLAGVYGGASAIGTANTAGTTLQNTTASTSGTPQQYAPAHVDIAHAWNTSGTPADNYVQLLEQLQASTGAAPVGTKIWQFSTSATSTPSYTNALSLTPSGLTVTGASGFIQNNTSGGIPGLTMYSTGGSNTGVIYDIGNTIWGLGYTTTVGGSINNVLTWGTSGRVLIGTSSDSGQALLQTQIGALTNTAVGAIALENQTLSLVGTQTQNAPGNVWLGHAWNTSGTPADNYIQAINYLVVTPGVSPIGTLTWGFSTSTTSTPSYTTVLSLAALGNTTAFFSGSSSTDPFKIQTTTTACYASIGFWNSLGAQKGSIGYGDSASGSFTNQIFINANSGVAVVLNSGGSTALTLSSSQNAQFAATVSASNGFVCNSGTAANNYFALGASLNNGLFDGGNNSLVFKSFNTTAITVSNTQQVLSVPSNTASSASASNYGFQINATINQTSVANFTDLLVNRTQTAAGSGTQRLIDLQVATASKFSVDNGGNTAISGSLDLGQNTTAAHALQWSSDTQIYRNALGQVTMTATSGNNPQIQILGQGASDQALMVFNASGAGQSWTIKNDTSNFVWRDNTAGVNTLTLAKSTGNATFSGGITIQGASTNLNVTGGTTALFNRSGGGYNFTVLNSNASPASGDQLGVFNFQGEVSSTATTLAQIYATINGGSVNNGRLIFTTSLAGAAAATVLTLDENKAATFTGTVNVNLLISSNDIQLGAASHLYFGSRSAITSPSDGQVTLSNNAGTVGATLNANTLQSFSGADALLVNNGGTAYCKAQTGGGITILANTGQSVSINSGGALALTLNSSQNAIFAGSVTAAGDFINNSDRRFKSKIINSDLGLNFILALRPVSYNMRDGSPGRHYGLIAQEVKKTLNGADFAGLSHDLATDRYGLGYNQFIAPLIKSIQELNGEIESLKKKLAKATKK